MASQMPDAVSNINSVNSENRRYRFRRDTVEYLSKRHNVYDQRAAGVIVVSNTRFRRLRVHRFVIRRLRFLFVQRWTPADRQERNTNHQGLW